MKFATTTGDCVALNCRYTSLIAFWTCEGNQLTSDSNDNGYTLGELHGLPLTKMNCRSLFARPQPGANFEMRPLTWISVFLNKVHDEHVE
jgi:hypothetical protein